MNEKNILEHAGKISHQLAVRKATQEYEAYMQQQRRLERLDSIRQLDRDIRRLSTRRRATSDDRADGAG